MCPKLAVLPPDLQSRIDDLYIFLGVAVPDLPGTGIDGFIPLIEHIKDRGGVFIIKWDGERNSRHYTAIAMHAESQTSCRIDDHTLELATAKVILRFAEAVLDFPRSGP